MTRVFISYRRSDSAGFAGRLYEHLSARLGDDAEAFGLVRLRCCRLQKRE